MSKFGLRSFAVVTLLLACRENDGSGDARWHLVMDGLSGALFSVTGTAPDDVWVAGAEQDGGLGPTLLHWDGVDWERLDTGVAAGDLLWGHVFEGGPRYFGGSDGVILRHDDGGLERMATPSTQTVWGIWGNSPEEMWAVGGQPDSGTGFIWRDRGDGWEVVALGDELPSPPSWFKVWGRAADDVWFCGMEGALLHWDGDAFETVDSGTSRSLLTVHGRADGSVVTAVGGSFSATLVESEDGGSWRDVTPTPEGAPPLQTFGVYHRDEVAYAVGIQSIVLRRDEGAWHPADHDLAVFGDLHSVWIDPAGGVWSAGGLVQAPPYKLGTLIYLGTTPPDTYEP